MRNETAGPRLANRDQQGDLKRDRSDLGLIRRISSWISLRLAVELLVESGVGHHLGVVLQRRGNILLLRRGENGARFRKGRKTEGERDQHDRAGERQPERQPEGASRRVHSGGLADSLLVDRRERVVVELGDEQSEADPGDRERHREVPAGIGPGDDGDQQDQPISRSANPALMMLLAAALALRPAMVAVPNTLSESGASDRPASSALYSRTIAGRSGS